MIKFKNENGITFANLVITIVILLILATVSINVGLSGISNSSDKQDLSILYMVQQAVLGQYSKASALEQADKKVSELTRVDQYFGTKISDISTIDISKITAAGVESPFASVAATYNTTVSSSNAKHEDFYYRLKTNDLKKLKITNPGEDEDVFTAEETTDTFIVNYKTGEVYNETKQITETGTVFYVKAKSIEKTKPEDLTSFTD